MASKSESKLKVTEMEDKKTNQPFPVGQTIETGRWSSRLPFFVPFLIEREIKKKEQPTNKQRKPQKRWKPGKKKLGKTQVIPQFPRRPMVKSKKKRRPTLGDRRGRKPLFFFYLLHRSFSARHGFVATSRFSFNARAKKTANFSVEGQKNAQNSFWKHFFCELLIMKRHSFLFGTEMKEETTISLTISR